MAFFKLKFHIYSRIFLITILSLFLFSCSEKYYIQNKLDKYGYLTNRHAYYTLFWFEKDSVRFIENLASQESKMNGTYFMSADTIYIKMKVKKGAEHNPTSYLSITKYFSDSVYSDAKIHIMKKGLELILPDTTYKFKRVKYEHFGL